MNSAVREGLGLGSVPKPMPGGSMAPLAPVAGAAGGGKTSWKETEFLLSFSCSSSLRESSLLCIQVTQVGAVALSPSSCPEETGYLSCSLHLSCCVSSHVLSVFFRDLAVTDPKANGAFLPAGWATVWVLVSDGYSQGHTCALVLMV